MLILLCYYTCYCVTEFFLCFTNVNLDLETFASLLYPTPSTSNTPTSTTFVASRTFNRETTTLVRDTTRDEDLWSLSWSPGGLCVLWGSTIWGWEREGRYEPTGYLHCPVRGIRIPKKSIENFDICRYLDDFTSSFYDIPSRHWNFSYLVTCLCTCVCEPRKE